MRSGPQRGPHLGTVITTATAKKRIGLLIDWANALAEAHRRPHELIPEDPEDPEGTITLWRFRRTVAWFIYRQPGGSVALGIQYGHAGTFLAASYGGRSKTDMLQVLNFESGMAMADTLVEAADRLTDGEAVSGPAADRYVPLPASSR